MYSSAWFFISFLVEYACLLACKHDSNKIPAAIPCFKDFSTRLDYCKDYPTCELVSNKRWWSQTGSRRAIKSDSFCNNLVVMPDPNSMSIAVGITLTLSCVQAHICVMSFLLPLNGRHLQFSTNLHLGQSQQ